MISTCENIRTFAVSDQWTAGDLCVFARMLCVNNSLSKLYIYDNQIDNDVVEAFAAAIKQNTTLQKLVIVCLSAVGSIALLDAVGLNTAMQKMTIFLHATSMLETDVMVAMGNMLTQNKSLRVLHFTGITIDAPCARLLVDGLAANSSLHTLKIFVRRLCVEGAAVLAVGLSRAPTLTVLDLSQTCDMSSEHVLQIATALRANTTLQTLLLGGREIRCEGIVSLANALKGNVTLKTLSAVRCRIGDEGAIALADMLKLNSTLHELIVPSGIIDAAGATALARALAENTSLTVLNLDNNNIPHTSVLAFADMLKTNATLRALCLAGGAFAMPELLRWPKLLRPIPRSWN